MNIVELEKIVQDWISKQEPVAGGSLTIKIDTEKCKVIVETNICAIDIKYLGMEAESFFKEYSGSSGGWGTPYHSSRSLLLSYIRNWSSEGRRTLQEFIEAWKSPTSYFKDIPSRRVTSYVISDAFKCIGCTSWT